MKEVLAGLKERAEAIAAKIKQLQVTLSAPTPFPRRSLVTKVSWTGRTRRRQSP